MLEMLLLMFMEHGGGGVCIINWVFPRDTEGGMSRAGSLATLHTGRGDIDVTELSADLEISNAERWGRW